MRDTYAGTFLLFTQVLPGFGVICEARDTDNHEPLVASIGRGCDLVYLESPTNPTLKLLDLERVIGAAHKASAHAAVDNTFATPINLNPVAIGADLVIHSPTKSMSGQGGVLGRVVYGRKDFIEEIYDYLETVGSSLDAHAAYMLLRSFKTPGLRVQRQNENAQGLPCFLDGQVNVRRGAVTRACRVSPVMRSPRHRCVASAES